MTVVNSAYLHWAAKLWELRTSQYPIHILWDELMSCLFWMNNFNEDYKMSNFNIKQNGGCVFALSRSKRDLIC